MTDTMLTSDGITQPISEWALDYGIYPAVIADRLARGWSTKRAITTPMIVAPTQRLTSEHLPGLPALRRNRNRAARRPAEVRPAKRRKRRAQFIEHDGQSRSIPQWAACLGITASTIRRRINDDWPVELVLTADRLSGKCRAGVSKNLPALEGTGGGSFAQDISEIEFSQ